MNLARFDDARFEWGRLDCCLFVAEVLREIHGKDFAAPWRGKYATEFGAKRLIAKHGGLQALLESALGPMRPASEARNGDPVLFGGKFIAADSIGGALGICHEGRIVYLTERGLARAPLSAALGAFHV